MTYKRPENICGFYIEASRETDFRNEYVEKKTGEVKVYPSMTKQEFVPECDINNIIKEFLQTGQFNHVNAMASQGAFRDLPVSMDFQEAVHLQLHAAQIFEGLPSRVRDRFGNDPSKFLEFFENPDNRDEAEKLGFIEPPAAPPQPMPVTVVNAAGPVVPPVPSPSSGDTPKA